MPCEYLSLDAMEKWIVCKCFFPVLKRPAFTADACLFSHLFPFRVLAVGFILCHSVLNSDATALSLWKVALQSSTCLCLFRDEVFHIHKAAEDLFVNIRGYEPEME